jgi:uncharacterized protein (TIGR03437 family)
MALSFAGLAEAQGGIGGGSPMACTAQTIAVPPSVRAEGFAELVGDLVLNCTGGTALTYGSQIGQADITVFLNTSVTSRVISQNGGNVSEALLLIDEPGSTTVSSYGATLSQNPCTPASGCAAYVGNVPAQNGSPAAAGVPVTAPGGTTPAPNVFPGLISSNTITFFGVPILPPATTGSRIYRFTNIRVNANAVGSGNGITASISISPSNAFSLSPFSFPLATVQSGLSTSLRNSTDTGAGGAITFSQCNSVAFGTSGAAGILRYRENFATAFKTRAALVNGNANPVAAFTGQNIPGQVYNSESAFTLASVSNGGTVAGVADWGTRLKAVFTNVPNGVTIYVSTTNVSGLTTAAAGGSSLPAASLLTSETVAEGAGTFASATVNAGNAGYAPVTIVNGTGVAVWEVTGNDYSAVQNFDFGIFLAYTASPQNGIPQAGPMSVNMSLAPNPTNGAFNAAQAASPAVNLVSRFADTSTANNFASIFGCTATGVVGPSNSTYGQPVSFTATAHTSAGIPLSIGTLSIADTTTNSVLASATPNVGQVSASLSGLNAGSHSIQASFSGPGLVSSSGSASINVGKATLTVSANNTSRVYGAPNLLTASYTGFVNGDNTGVLSGAPSLNSVATVASPPGVYTITAAAGTLGAANYAFSLVNGSLSVVKASTVVTLTLGGGVLFASVGVSLPGAGTPTGTIQFLNGATVLGTAPVIGLSASLPTSLNGTFTAVYSGDGNFNGSTSNAVTNSNLPPPQANSTVTISSSANPSNLGQSVTFTASIGTSGSAPSSAPTGNLQFSDGAKLLGSSGVSGGQATFTASGLTGGVHSIVAQYSGDTNYSGAQATYPQTVLAPVTVTLSASSVAPVFGQTVVLTASVTGNAPAGFAAPTGQVTFEDAANALFQSNTTLGAATLSSGTATFSASHLSVGTHTLIAFYGGDATWPSNSQRLTLTVSPAPTTTTVSLSVNSSGQVVLTARVTSTAGAPTGSVQFTDTSDNLMVANASLSGGSAAVTTTALAGSRPIDAVYSGDVNFQASVSAPIPVALNAAADSMGSFAPDEVAALFNITGLNGDTPATLPLTSSLGGVTIKITDSAGTGHVAQLYGVFASTGQINFLIPGDAAAGTALAAVTLPGGGTLTAVFSIAPSAAGIFTANMNGQGVFSGQVLHVHPDGSQTVANAATQASSSQSYVPNPIDFGPSGDQVFLVLYGTGLRHAGSLTATVNGVPVPVSYFGAQGQYPGLDQIDLSLPRSLAGAGLVNIVITADGQTANVVTTAIQ